MSQSDQYRRDVTEDDIEEVRQLLNLGQKPKDIQQRLLERGLAPDVAKYIAENIREEKPSAVLGSFLAILAAVFFIVGVILYGGNLTGLFPTFPYAGFLFMLIGGGIFWLAQAVDD